MMESWILIILVIMPGVWSGDWKVTYKNQCALKGTSVVIKCEYDYPSGHGVTLVYWTKAQRVDGRWRLFYLSVLPSPPGHFEYVGNYESDCSLKINNVQHTDEGPYLFKFATTNNRWTSKTFAQLFVSELTAVVEPSTVTEGNNVSLSCMRSCRTQTHIVWFRDGQLVTYPVFQARREDAGRYYCAVLGQEMVRSASVALNVQYAPNNVMLSVSPSDVVKGSAVTFSCNSDANPPVTQSGYSLYKDRQFISSGQIHTIAVIQPSHSGRYYCQAWNNISWRGVEFINSTEANLDVQYRPMNMTVSMDPPNVVVGSSVNLTCSSAANPASHSYTWYKRTASPSSSSQLLQVGSGQVLSLPSVEASHTGLYLCQARNHLGENTSSEVLLTVEGKKNVSQSVQILSGIGVALFVTFVIVLLLFWMKRKTHAEKKADTSYEDNVTYSTVTIKPRNPSLAHHMNSNAPQDSWSTAGKNDDAVIYSVIAKSS